MGQRIGIHAGKKYDRNALDMAAHYLDLDLAQTREFVERFGPQSCPRGAVVCTTIVFAGFWLKQSKFKKPVEKLTLCPWEGKFGLLLSDIQKVDPPVPAQGHQGIWEWGNGGNCG